MFVDLVYIVFIYLLKKSPQNVNIKSRKKLGTRLTKPREPLNL